MRGEPLTSKTAKAMSPRYPTNQVAHFWCLPDDSSVVPTCPYTGCPPTFAPRAAPEVTASRIRERRLVSVVMANGLRRDCCASGGRVTSDGSCQLPVATWAATTAIVSGLTRTFPWPMVAAASFATPLELPTVPENPGSGSCHVRPKPNPEAALLSSAVLSPCDSPASAVAQDCAKSVANVAPGSGLARGTLRKLFPPTELTGLQGMVVFTGMPLASSASADTMMKAPPGGCLHRHDRRRTRRRGHRPHGRLLRADVDRGVHGRGRLARPDPQHPHD